MSLSDFVALHKIRCLTKKTGLIPQEKRRAESQHAFIIEQ